MISFIFSADRSNGRLVGPRCAKLYQTLARDADDRSCVSRAPLLTQRAVGPALPYMAAARRSHREACEVH